jgi:Methane oxygenase PmoA
LKFHLFSSLTALGLLGLPAHAQVAITLQNDRVAVNINGTPFTNLYMGQDVRKPFLYPLTTASGKRVNRGFPVEPVPGDPTDHPHQRGLWVGAEQLSAGDLGLMDFWENDPSYKCPHMGSITFKDILDHKNGDKQGSFTFIADWISKEGVAVLSETRTMTFYAEPRDCRMFDVDLRLRAKHDLAFEDNDDAVIGIRLSPAFDQKNGGQPINAQGSEGEANVRGRRSEWIDWQTKLEGEDVGVTLMDHPANFSSPTRWHVRSFGLMIANPFGQHEYLKDAPVVSNPLHAGEELHLRYRVLIHPKTTGVAQIYKEFAGR